MQFHGQWLYGGGMIFKHDVLQSHSSELCHHQLSLAFFSATFNSWWSEVNVKGHQGVGVQIPFHHLKFWTDIRIFPQDHIWQETETTNKSVFIQVAFPDLLSMTQTFIVSHLVWEGWLKYDLKQLNKCCSWSEKCSTTEWDNFSHQYFWSQHF